MFRRQLLRYAIAGVTIGMALLAGPNRAKADLRVTLNSGMAPTQQFFAVGNSILFSTTIDGYSVVIDTGLTNFMGSPAGGTLSTTLNLATNAGPVSALTVLTEVVTAPTAVAPLAIFTIPSAAGGVNFTGQVGGTPGNSTGGTVSMTTTVNGVSVSSPTVAILPTSESNLSGSAGPNPSGYTQTQLVTVSGLSINSSSITVNASQLVTATPEPSTFALALTSVPFLGMLWARRRKQA